METTYRWGAVAALAPVAWGANYFVTHQYLPADSPWWGAALRALPAGCLLLALSRRLPRGAWWWKSAVLGLLNTSAFFLLVYLAAHLLTTATASTLMALSPAALMLSAWALLSERPRVAPMAGAAIGLGGVVLMLAGQAGAPSVPGLLASAGALASSSVGYALSKRWGTGAGVLASTAWQLTFGGVLLLVAALVFEGGPPPLTAPGAAALAYTALIATALAFVAWLTGLRHLPAATVGLIGLLNPVTGVALGVALGGEPLGVPQAAGMALVLAGIALGRPGGGRTNSQSTTRSSTTGTSATGTSETRSSTTP
ncbi:DMT family transporter [Streptomyces endophyticus]|uniref:DMT family transporter n=1 Tax=Streptomyces endophyticus TaxID=714166 RepID=A0ABU6F2I7_9ACTN|nr:DMT family transporter [Streptomyces endophyticus]MEB8338211.1 DMT family transporter [Streptomyces endophyticus]